MVFQHKSPDVAGDVRPLLRECIVPVCIDEIGRRLDSTARFETFVRRQAESRAIAQKVQLPALAVGRDVFSGHVENILHVPGIAEQIAPPGQREQMPCVFRAVCIDAPDARRQFAEAFHKEKRPVCPAHVQVDPVRFGFRHDAQETLCALAPRAARKSPHVDRRGEQHASICRAPGLAAFGMRLIGQKINH